MLTIFFSLGIVWQQIMEEISYAGSRNRGKKRLSKRLLIFGGLFLLVLVLLGSAIYFITSDEKAPESEEQVQTTDSISLPAEDTLSETPTLEEEVSVTPEKSTTPTKSPSTTPSASNSKADIKISVQNGSGVTGAAGDAADVLRTAGYTISSTGNADNSDYADVTIRIKNSKKASLSAIEDTLSDDYTVGETTTTLPESTSYDVLVIVGK